MVRNPGNGRLGMQLIPGVDADAEAKLLAESLGDKAVDHHSGPHGSAG